MPDPAPARVLGPIDATCVVVGAIIGVGIFRMPASVVGETGSGSLALLAWVVGGLIALAGALTFGALGARYHSSGAQYEILRDCYGRFPAFLFVFCNATAIQAGAIGIIALICTENLLVLAGSSTARVGPGATLLISVALIVGITLANVSGVRWGSRIQNLTVYAKVLTLCLVTLLALFAGSHSVATSLPPDPENARTQAPMALVLAALVPIFFSYGGWQHALWISGEVREPHKNLPRAIVGGVGLVVLIYVLANWAYLRLLGAQGVAGSEALAADAVSQVWPHIGRAFVAVAVAISAFGVLNVQLLSGPRLVYGMAADGRFFAPFARLHPRFGTPMNAILLLTVAALVLLLLAGWSGTATIDRLTTGVVLIDSVFFGLTGAAVFVLKRRQLSPAQPTSTDGSTTWHIPGYPVIPALFVIGELGIVAGSFYNANSSALIGVAWIAAAGVVYATWFRRTTGWSAYDP